MSEHAHSILGAEQSSSSHPNFILLAKLYQNHQHLLSPSESGHRHRTIHSRSVSVYRYHSESRAKSSLSSTRLSARQLLDKTAGLGIPTQVSTPIMASFDELPLEMHWIVMVSLSPHDLRNMTLMTKKYKTAYNPFLYKKVELNGASGHGIDQMIWFLRTVMSTPSLAAHVRDLQLEDWTWGPRRGQKREVSREHNAARPLLSNMPGLKRLILRASEICHVIAGAFLPKVTAIRVERTGDIGFNLMIPMSEVKYLMSLRSLKILTLNRPIKRTAHPRCGAVQKLHTLTVNDIRIDLEVISDDTFLAVYGIPARLEKVILTQTKPAIWSLHFHNCQSYVHNQAISRALMLHKGSLRSLVINGPRLCPCLHDKLDSLRDFACLTEITIPPQLLWDGQAQPERVRKMSHLSPASLETLILDWDPLPMYTSSYISWSEIVEDLAVLSHQPNLKSITIRVRRKIQLMRCMRCQWYAAVCALCEEMKTICELCYNGRSSRKMEKACTESSRALLVPWMRNHIPHPSDHLGDLCIERAPLVIL